VELSIDHNKNFIVTIEHMAMFVVKSIHIQMNGQYSYHEYFYGTDNVHGGSNSRAQVKEHTDSPSKLWPQGARYHKVGATRRHHAVSCDGAH